MGNSCSNSSNLYGNVNITTVSSGEGAAGGARLVMTIPLSGISGGLEGNQYITKGVFAYPFQIGGVTAGDVLRYNAIAYDASTEPTGGKYVKANANSAGTSEVVGVVEDINVVDEVANVVIYGQVKYPTHRLFDAEHVDAAAGATGSAGGNDVYFLSGTTAGYLQNLAPATPTYVAKPVLQMASDPNAPDFNAIVANYIGYQIGGEIIISNEEEGEGTYVEMLSNLAVDLDNDPCRHNLSGVAPIFPITSDYSAYLFADGRTYLSAYNRLSAKNAVRAYVHKITFTSAVTDNQSTKPISQLSSSGTSQFRGTGMYRDAHNPKVLYVKSNDKSLNNNTMYIGGVAFTKSSSEICGFMLGKMGTNSTQTATDPISGKTYKENKVVVVQMCPDQGRSAASIPNEVTIDKLNINTTLKAGNTDIEIADVADTLNTMKDQVSALNKSVYGQGEASSASLSSKFTSK